MIESTHKMKGMVPFIEHIRRSTMFMTNPFKNDEKFKNFISCNNCKYAVIHYNWDCDKDEDSFTVIGFDDYKEALNNARQISDDGLWAYIINVSNDDVLMYLTGWCLCAIK